jgi:LmbE family N-acetylglucosaminyl deacetylase
MKQRIVFLLLCFLLFLSEAESQVRTVYDKGVLGLGQILKRLQTTASALHIGAHPDDEDSALLAYLARKEQARTAYLSLNRGEGGQNAIGSEIFEPLGIIRTEELLQARQFDGAEQFFTRAMDFGFSKTLAESSRLWNEKIILEDMVRVIRTYRPLVIISRFTGTPADGHGHHQLAGYLTTIAFKAAADPNQFPEQLKEGLKTWQAKKLYVSQGFMPNPQNVPTLLLNTGEHDFLLGRSYYEIAIEGRSQHKSQEMGGLELRGKQTSGVRLLESFVPTNPEKETSVFDGIDTSLVGAAELFGEKNNQHLLTKLMELQKIAKKALENFDPLNTEKLIPILSEGFKVTQEAELLTENFDCKLILKQKKTEFAKALMLASGIVVDALSDNETPIPGSSVTVAVRIFAPEKIEIKIGEISLKLPKGWKAEKIVSITPAQETALSIQREKARYSEFFKVSIPKNEKPTQPYWLESPRENFIFVWNDEESKSFSFQPSLIRAKGKIAIADVEIPFEKDVEYRYADAVRGEIRRNINVVPRISVATDSEFIISPISNEKTEREIKVSVINNGIDPTKGTLKLLLPEGWSSSPVSVDFQLENKGERASFAFKVTIPPSVQGDYKVIAQAVSGGEVFDQTMHTVSYPHIQTHRYYKKAQTEIKIFDLKVAQVNVGYIMGSGDKVPEAIKRMGLNVTLLEEKDLSIGDLSKFDVIVVGIRASQVRPDFVANNNRLLNYVRAGGVLIVQYQQPDYIRQNLAPYPAKMEVVTRGSQVISNLRVTDENAPVKILVPDHPIFNFPNKITDEDWIGWIQERNLYCFTEFDPRYIPLLESHDEGEPENKGGMLYAEIDRGKFIYTAYSWFRQLPAGNKGAYRIFANMLSLPKAMKDGKRQ